MTESTAPSPLRLDMKLVGPAAEVLREQQYPGEQMVACVTRLVLAGHQSAALLDAAKEREAALAADVRSLRRQVDSLTTRMAEQAALHGAAVNAARSVEHMAAHLRDMTEFLRRIDAHQANIVSEAQVAASECGVIRNEVAVAVQKLLAPYLRLAEDADLIRAFLDSLINRDSAPLNAVLDHLDYESKKHVGPT